MTNKEAIESVELAFSAWESEYSTTGDDWSKEHEAIKALEEVRKYDNRRSNTSNTRFSK